MTETPLWLPSADGRDLAARLEQKRDWAIACSNRLNAAWAALESARREYDDAYVAWKAAEDEQSRERYAAQQEHQPARSLQGNGGGTPDWPPIEHECAE
jgi:hypothetical protein